MKATVKQFPLRRKDQRPLPPDALWKENQLFLPAPEIGEWVQRVILDEGGVLHNPDHQHLNGADLKFMWAAGGFTRQQRTVVGQAV